MKLKPELYLTKPELDRLSVIASEGRTKYERHKVLAKKLRTPGLLDDEKVELRELSREITALIQEQHALYARNPLLPENVVKAMDAANKAKPR
jgi:hypothetical protein